MSANAIGICVIKCVYIEMNIVNGVEKANDSAEMSEKKHHTPESNERSRLCIKSVLCFLHISPVSCSATFSIVIKAIIELISIFTLADR